MKSACRYFFLVILLALCSDVVGRQMSNVEKLWYTSPAEYFINALPVGNGRLAAMVYGRTDNEIIHLNEESLWSGGPIDLNPNPDSPKFLEAVRAALDQEDYALADKLSRKMQGLFTQSYSPVGNLLIHQLYGGNVSNYHRELDLQTAIVTTSFDADGIHYEREVFVSYPDQVIILHLTSSQPGALSFEVSMESLLHPAITCEDGQLVMRGNAPSAADPTYIKMSDEPVRWGDACKGMRFQSRIKVLHHDGKLDSGRQSITIQNASDVTLAVSIATSYNGFDKCPVSEGKDEEACAKKYLLRLNEKEYRDIRQRHIQDYSSLYNKVRLFLKGNESMEQLPTDIRMERYQQDTADHGLETLLYNYGRYLFISSSRPGGIAANLQGKWNVDIQPAWSCNYTVNINFEMNYWASDKVGLGELNEPYVHQVSNMAKTGAYTARNFYKCHGWAAGHNSDIWATTNPVGNVGMGSPQWANWAMASPWLCQLIWDKYAYSLDKDYLKNTAYPIMKGAADFCLDWLVEDKDGYLITSPSTSPENCFKDRSGKVWAVTKGATMDLALIRNLFENLISATEVLNIDKDYAERLRNALARIRPYQIGKKGNLQEWGLDYNDADPTHRHVSHLASLHPGHDISAWNTPDLFNACKRTLEIRGDGGTGWSRVWKICFWSRLLDGDHAYRLLRNDLELTRERGFSESGGTYTNLFNACPPFQIDGNYGVVEGISEMLLQSHLGEIHLLPALPKAWGEGFITGILARGGYEVDMTWKNAKLQSAEIHCQQAGICRLRTNIPIKAKGKKVSSRKEHTIAGDFYLNEIQVSAGETIYITKR